ncbi:MAG: transglutaminase domain-containing protein, partial [Patescibacteria group bacterium]
IRAFVHELLHFQTYAYWQKEVLKKLSKEEFENLKEALTVVLNEEFMDLDKGYLMHRDLRKELLKYWKKNKDFNKLIKYGIKIYPKYADEIKYLMLGKYTSGCPKYLLDKVDKMPNNKINRKYIEKVLRIISDEFNSKKYKLHRTHDFRESRFISVAEILKIRQASCGSMATVVAAVLRQMQIPVKLIHGNFSETKKSCRHAWNEVYINGKFIPFDITRKNLKITKKHIRISEWADWADLEIKYRYKKS